MDNFIKVYDDVLDKESCTMLIEKFESLEEQQEKVHRVDGDNVISFNQINLFDHKDWESIQSEMLDMFQHYIIQYKLNCDVTKKMWPETYGYEAIRMKRYLNNDYDRFDDHVDVLNYETSRRFLAFFVYLNDVEKGGETEFINFNKPGTYLPHKIQAKRGRLMMFPPLWMYWHAGRKPVSSNKYIIHSYCHYG